MNLRRLFQICLMMLGLFATSTAVATDSDSHEEAKRHFSAGMAYLADPAGPKLEEAYREFRVAYELQPSYLVLSNIGYCALHLELDSEAIDAYKGFLEKATSTDLTPRQRRQMETDVQMLSAGLVTIALQTLPEKVMITDERFSSNGPVRVNRYPVVGGTSQLGIHPGSHKFTATADGFESQTWEFDADPASKHTHEFKLVPVGGTKLTFPPATGTQASAAMSGTQVPSNTHPPGKAEGGSAPTAVYVGGAITGVLAIATVATGLMAIAKKSDYDEKNRDGAHPKDAQDLRHDAKQYALFSDIGLGATVLAAGITTYLYLAGPEHPSTQASTRTGFRLSPSLGRNQTGLSVSGLF